MTKKRFLLALALMLTAVGGAWAQGVEYYLAGSMTTWNLSTPAYKLTYTDYVNAYTLTTTLSANDEFTVVGTDFGWYPDNNNYVVSASGTYTIYFDPAGNHDGWHGGYFNVVEGSLPPAPGTLVEDGNNQWHLTTPAGNVTLSVDYYGQYRLDSIPQGWQVKVNGALMGSDTLKAYTDGGNPQMRYIAAINETDSVELIPPAELRGTIKAVRLTESVAAPAVVEPITVTWNSTALSAMYTAIVSGSQSRTQDDVTVTMTSSGGSMYFGPLMSVNGTGNFVFSTELGNITQIVISFSESGDWTGANAGWPSELYTYGAGTFTWSGTPASSVTLSGEGGNAIYGITSIVFTIQPNN